MDRMQVRNEIEELPSSKEEGTYNYRVCLTDGVEKLECKLNIISKEKVIKVSFDDVNPSLEEYCDQLELIIVKLLLFEFYSKEKKKNINIMDYNIKVYCDEDEYDEEKFVDMVEDYLLRNIFRNRIYYIRWI